jgi:hypothetical protein
MREEAICTILKSIDREHPAVSNVQKNMAALLKSRIPKERHEGWEDLESIVSRYPNHLNYPSNPGVISKSVTSSVTLSPIDVSMVSLSICID